MGWDRGYYYRVRKANGRVVRDYIGGGEVATLCAQLDAITREEREQAREARRAHRAELEALDAPLQQLDERLNLLTEAVLLAAGYRRHHRGEWRKRREQPTDEIEK